MSAKANGAQKGPGTPAGLLTKMEGVIDGIVDGMVEDDWKEGRVSALDRGRDAVLVPAPDADAFRTNCAKCPISGKRQTRSRHQSSNG